jgi:hypothetical protein
MAGNLSWFSEHSFRVHVEVAAADAAVGDLDHDVVIAAHGIGHVLDSDIAWAV